MNALGLSDTRIRLIRWVCILFASTSFVIGPWMMIDPTSAWGSMGVDVAAHPLAPAIYGGAIMGEGVMFALGAVWPVRYLVFLQYLVLYKTFACLAGIAVLAQMNPAPIGGWMVIAGWGFAGATAAAVFPWKQWRHVEAWYGAE